jgi:hypothetical protein
MMRDNLEIVTVVISEVVLINQILSMIEVDMHQGEALAGGLTLEKARDI